LVCIVRREQMLVDERGAWSKHDFEPTYAHLYHLSVQSSVRCLELPNDCIECLGLPNDRTSCTVDVILALRCCQAWLYDVFIQNNVIDQWEWSKLATMQLVCQICLRPGTIFCSRPTECNAFDGMPGTEPGIRFSDLLYLEVLIETFLSIERVCSVVTSVVCLACICHVSLP
jgi:hypothetical protein